MSWNDITVKMYQEICDINNSEMTLEEKLLDIMCVIFGEDVLDLPLNEFNLKVQEIVFLDEKLPVEEIKKGYVVNGREYVVTTDLTRLSTAQYVDFTNLIKSKSTLDKIISVFMLPKGIDKYLNGYNFEDVVKDMGDLSIVTANSIAFFFDRQLKLFIEIFRFYLMKNIRRAMKKKKMTQKEKELMNKTIKMIQDLELYHSY